jgi:hypothetical protein
MLAVVVAVLMAQPMVREALAVAVLVVLHLLLEQQTGAAVVAEQEAAQVHQHQSALTVVLA